ncbi:MAG: type II toxin-antitoxin system RelE/ParE family toxin [Clostridia bacterium]|nr:type II toxin-antitoxin system RelE/ParE family toxin [Clostridia bacterium]MCI9275259.1 type II toxin-antitoxin system RelE/ParE family toxin [Clostridia bacterium]
MTFKIISTKRFERDIKTYQKKYRSINEDVKQVIDKLKEGNILGKVINNLKIVENNERVIKVRVPNSDTDAGQANGYRLIYYLNRNNMTIYLLTIYYKKEKENMTNKEIENLFSKYL